MLGRQGKSFGNSDSAFFCNFPTKCREAIDVIICGSFITLNPWKLPDTYLRVAYALRAPVSRSPFLNLHAVPCKLNRRRPFTVQFFSASLTVEYKHLEEEPTMGFEPTALWLQIKWASDCATSAKQDAYQSRSFFLIFSISLFFSLRWRSRTRGGTGRISGNILCAPPLSLSRISLHKYSRYMALFCLLPLHCLLEENLFL